MGDYDPQNVTGRTFEEIHPKGDGEPVQIDDLVKIPGNDTRWIVTGFNGDFAKLTAAEDSRKTFAYRRTALEVIER